MSEAANGACDTDEIFSVSENTADSDVFRAIIDLDRFLYLIESGYDVLHKAEMFVAKRNGEA